MLFHTTRSSLLFLSTSITLLSRSSSLLRKNLTTGPSFARKSDGAFTHSSLNKGILSFQHHKKMSSTTKLSATKSLQFQAQPLEDPDHIVLIGYPNNLSNENIPSKFLSIETNNDSTKAMIHLLLKSLTKGSSSSGGKETTFLPNARCTFIALPDKDKLSRNNHPLSPHFLSDSLAGIKGDQIQIYVIDEDVGIHVGAISTGIARAFPLYSAKSSSKELVDSTLSTSFIDSNLNPIGDGELWLGANAVAKGVRLAASLADMPPEDLTTEAYSGICKEISKELGDCVTFEEIVGVDLMEAGYGGVYAVGKGAESPPRIVIMTYSPENVVGEYESIALVGKGVVYDTGGLSLKTKAGMCGMKHDMGGSAGVLGAFQAAVTLKVPNKITLILGLAENAIGPKAVRNDDVITMHSGKTVEINNTDAEGRLILGDCVSHASKCLKVDLILDMATLTGAQLVCTGKKHAGILSKSAKLEQRMFASGLSSGDFVYPLLYAPELLKSEFNSKVADMKNSVKDRGNAQSSCAGHFVEAHLDENYDGDWVHVDMAGPSTKNERATGYGVALVLGLLAVPGF